MTDRQQLALWESGEARVRVERQGDTLAISYRESSVARTQRLVLPLRPGLLVALVTGLERIKGGGQ